MKIEKLQTRAMMLTAINRVLSEDDTPFTSPRNYLKPGKRFGNLEQKTIYTFYDVEKDISFTRLYIKSLSVK